MGNGRLRIINAAIRVVIRDGVTSVTLAAVATEAGLSKGGLLYHFPSKERLFEAIVEHQAEEWRQNYRDAYDRAPEGPGRMASAILADHLLNRELWSVRAKNTFAATIAALAHDPGLLAPLKNVHAEVQERLSQDGLPPGVSEAISSAVDGVWLNWGLGVGASDEEYINRVYDALKNLLSSSIAKMEADEASLVPTTMGMR